MISQQVAPLFVLDVDPASTADSAGFGVAQDGQTYVIKSPLKHPLLPATEAFCESLAVACQLPATTGAWLDVAGVWCYGSRFEGGLDKPVADASPLQMDLRKRQWQRCTNPGIASAAFALDLFVFNVDRHHNNWAFQDQNGNVTARVFDFSRAWWTFAPDLTNLPDPDKMKLFSPRGATTCNTYKTVRGWAGDNRQAAQNVLDLLKLISTRWVENQLTGLPAGWIDQSTLSSTLSWWDSPLKNARITNIEQGLNNATLF